MNKSVVNLPISKAGGLGTEKASKAALAFEQLNKKNDAKSMVSNNRIDKLCIIGIVNYNHSGEKLSISKATIKFYYSQIIDKLLSDESLGEDMKRYKLICFLFPF